MAKVIVDEDSIRIGYTYISDDLSRVEHYNACYMHFDEIVASMIRADDIDKKGVLCFALVRNDDLIGNIWVALKNIDNLPMVLEWLEQRNIEVKDYRN